jgi:hypothetical protein
MKAVGKIFGGGQKAPDTSAQEAILARQEKQAADERARLATEQMARSRAAKRGGGFRSLLSEQRLSPETGLQNTLGPG